MNFFDHLKKQAETLNTQGGNFNDDEVVYPSINAERLYLSKKTPVHVGRVLPSVGMLNGTSEDFATPVRSIFFPNPVPGAKPQNVNLNLAPEKDPNSPIENAIMRWADTGAVASRYGKVFPRTSFLVNFIPYMDNGAGQYVPVVGQDGLPKLTVIELPQSAYIALIGHLTNSLLAPQLASTGAVSETSFLSLEESILVDITKANPGETSHKVNVYGHIRLGDIRGQVEHKMEDLSVLQYSTEDVNPGLVKHIIQTIDGTKDEGEAQVPTQAPQAPVQQVPTQAPQAPAQQAPAQQAPAQQAPVQQVPTQAPQQPVQQVPQQPVQQVPTQPVQQVPTQPVQQAPQQPVQQAPQQPVQQVPQAPGANGISAEQQALMDSLRGGL